MNATGRLVTRSGSDSVVVGLAGSWAGAATRGGAPFAIPVPPQLQTAVAVDREGNQVLVGAFAGRLRVPGGELTSAGGTDIFVTKTSRAGAPVFPPERFGGPGDDAATGVAVDEDGSIVLSGTFQGEIEFGGQRLRAQVRHPGQRAVFIARLDPAGKLVWVEQIAVANQPTQVSVAVGPDHNIVVGVTATGTVASTAGQVVLPGQSVTLDVLSPKGDPITPPAPKVMAHVAPRRLRAFALPDGRRPDAGVRTRRVRRLDLRRPIPTVAMSRGTESASARSARSASGDATAGHLHSGQRLLPGCLRLHRSGLQPGPVLRRDLLGLDLHRRGEQHLPRRLPAVARAFATTPTSGRRGEKRPQKALDSAEVGGVDGPRIAITASIESAGLAGDAHQRRRTASAALLVEAPGVGRSALPRTVPLR